MSVTCTLISDQKKIKTYSYDEYMSLMESYSTHEVTSGNDQSLEKINFTKINLTRMKRWNKTIVLDPQLIILIQNLKDPQCWTVITEAWCGDGAQNIPVLAKIAEVSEGKINFQLVFRDDNPQFMNQYLTNGGKAIPKLIARDTSEKDLFCWGPRPEAAVSIMHNWKVNPMNITKSEIEVTLHAWYAQNKQHDLMLEILNLMAANVAPKNHS
ncbi:MAG: thioredoxin family protein [Crocinitomix sp.]|jgi:hypothetical protein|nr:thioredoxin family protein [Crocinitomix sp.]